MSLPFFRHSLGWSRWGTLAACALLVACAGAPRYRAPGEPVEPGVVSVTTTDPGQFSEARSNPRETPHQRRAWVDALSGYLAERAASALAPDQRLEVRITDVRRAGGFEPWRGPQGSELRTVRDTHVPRIDLEFTLRAVDGRVLREGQRQLRDSGFLMRPGAHASDPLLYEKRLVDDWVGREFGVAR